MRPAVQKFVEPEVSYPAREVEYLYVELSAEEKEMLRAAVKHVTGSDPGGEPCELIISFGTRQFTIPLGPVRP